MIKIRGWYMVAISLILGLAAAWVASSWLVERVRLADAKNVDVTVAVAALEIPYGTTVKANHVKLIRMRQGTELGSYFTTVEQVTGKVAKQKLLSGEVLLKDKFTESGAGSTLAALIRPQMRAVTVRVDDVVGVAGFLLPGNHVDVIAARKAQERATTRTILSDLNVLAVDQTSGTDKNEPVVVRAVTLEMTPQQAEVLMRAREEGRIQLTLRNPNDQSVLQEVAEVEKSVEKKVEPPVIVAPAAVTKKPRATAAVIPTKIEPQVTIIRGTYVEGSSSK